MQISPIGFVVCAVILLTAHYCRSVLIVGLLASVAFGSTALVALTGLGGSSPLIYTLFSALLITVVVLRRQIWSDLGVVFGSMRPIWLLTTLMAYAIVGSWLLPRFFAGQTTVFVQGKTRGGVVETSLVPVGGNITQTGYFVLGGLTAIALCILLMNRGSIRHIRTGMFVMCILHAGMGMIDLLGKLAGAGDVLEPIRTASYAMLTEAVEGGFYRIAGAYSEASAFGARSLACLAFVYTYWRRTNSDLAKWLAIVILMLTVLSTSSTAYVGLAILCVPVGFSISKSFLQGRIMFEDLLIVILLCLGIVAVMAIVIRSPEFFSPFVKLLDEMVLNKASSTSGQERTYWNVKSLQSFVDTSGLGIGIGSSRASSWLIAVISQLGVIGALLMAILLAYIARGLGRLSAWVPSETAAIVASVRNYALAGIVSGSLISGTPDPGLMFFVAFAVIAAARFHARRYRRTDMRLLASGSYIAGPPGLRPSLGHAG
ncbi:hypothetical protein [Mesorhizobium xinjiangense]|uniref:hypothetical protein n=1 Tax=Mesorhizobium xinjiangense TaxID=2678685 RepID=UPI0018DCDEC2|nr:hypothetical protein [Mesorhizobium xinjiangense]